MASIYRNSHVTLAASGSVNAHGGLFHELPDFLYQIHHIETVDETGESHIVPVRRCIPHPTDDTKEGFPLLERAWVYQERLLSARFLHFGPYEVVWEYRQHTICVLFCSTFNEWVASPEHYSLPLHLWVFAVSDIYLFQRQK